MTTQNKDALILAIQHLLQQNTIGTQDEICAALQKQGHAVNQVKVSRLLHKIGAIKMIEAGKTVYRLPREFASVTPRDSLQHLILGVTHNDNLIVVQTAPGSAQLVARLLDQHKENDILGTVAGDDTIFIAPANSKEIAALYTRITRLLLK